MISFKNYLKQSLLLEHTDVNFLKHTGEEFKQFIAPYIKNADFENLRSLASNDDLELLLPDFLKLLWENYIYEILEENLVDTTTQQSINISSDIQKKLDSSVTDYDLFAILEDDGPMLVGEDFRNSYGIYVKDSVELGEHSIQLIKDIFLDHINPEVSKLKYFRSFIVVENEEKDITLGSEIYHHVKIASLFNCSNTFIKSLYNNGFLDSYYGKDKMVKLSYDRF